MTNKKPRQSRLQATEPPAEPVAPEQIGPLLFVPNAEYPYPFTVPVPPRFWMEEQTGALAEAVEIFMRTEPLTPEQIELMQIYLRQYVERAVTSGDANRKLLLSQLDKVGTIRDLDAFVEELAEWGIEPL